MPVHIQFEYKLLMLIGVFLVACVIFFFTVIKQSPEIPSLLKYCNGSAVDPLSESSNGAFSCCGDNQICDKKWWTDYAPTISGGKTTNQGVPTTLDMIIKLVQGGGVTGDFLKDQEVREKAHSVVAGEVCKDTCASFRQGTYVTSTSRDEAMEKLESILGDPANYDQLTLKDGNDYMIHTGKCTDACNKSTGCKNFIFLNRGDNNNSDENGLCLMVTDDQVEDIIDQFDMKEIGDGTTLGLGDEIIISVFTGGDFQLS